MLKNYLKTALRGMRRHPTFAGINILGLALGLFVAFMILLWVRDEMSYDTMFSDADRIMEVMRTSTQGGIVSTTNSITANLDPVLDEEYPEIEIASLVGWNWDITFVKGDLSFRNDTRWAGPEFFQVVDYPFVAGDPATALSVPESVVFTESTAAQYFPDVYANAPNPAVAAQEVLGQFVRLENRLDVTVTGIVKDFPSNVTYGFEALVPFEEYRRRNDWVEGWGNNGFRMLLKLTPGADHEAVSDKIRMIVQDNQEANTSVLFLQPLKDRHLWSKYDNGVLVGGRIEYVRIMGVVALLILVIAAINFTNLTTARSAQRAMEIGIRKSFGGSRSSLAGQFIGEAMLTAFAALIVAVGAVALLLPGFNNLTDKDVALGSLGWGIWAMFGGLTLLTGLLAGAYPAAYLSNLGIIKVLRGSARSTGGGGALRRALVVFQFAISVLLIVGTMTVYSQLNYIQTKNLGLDRENVYTIELEGGARDQYTAFKSRLLQHPGILSISTGWENPFDVNTSTSDPDFDGKDPDDNTSYYVSGVGYDFIETMGMELLAGRVWDPAQPLDSAHVIINETAAATMPVSDPVGERWDMWGREGVVLAVVKDFHMTSMYSEIGPMALQLNDADGGSAFFRLAPGNVAEAIETIEAVYREMSPEFAYQGRFLDDDYDAMYRSEAIIGTLANWFAILAIVIACLGLYGLASFTTARRTKEIGVRKVLGASVPSVILLLTREFALLIGIAFVVAAPVAWIFMSDWLAGFEYHIDLGLGIFASAALGMLIITYATVGWQSFRAAVANPAESLRTE